jgi:hypothetical protein
VRVPARIAEKFRVFVLGGGAEATTRTGAQGAG